MSVSNKRPDYWTMLQEDVTPHLPLLWEAKGGNKSSLKIKRKPYWCWVSLYHDTDKEKRIFGCLIKFMRKGAKEEWERLRSSVEAGQIVAPAGAEFTDFGHEKPARWNIAIKREIPAGGTWSKEEQRAWGQARALELVAFVDAHVRPMAV